MFGIPASPLEARHRPSGLNTQFNGDGLSFNEYVARNRDMLAKAHAKLGAADLQKLIDGNAPFELKPNNPSPPPVRAREGAETSLPCRQKPYRRGVLLTHGLTGSPYFMRHLAGFFQENGFRVMAVLLPGHGTQPGDLLDVRWPEWARTVAYGADRLAEEVDEVYLAGYSIGGTLSAYQSLCDSRVRGLFLFSPAIRITPRAAFASLHKLYSWLIPSAKWVDIMPDRDIYKYESFTKNAAAQTHALTRHLGARLRLHELDIPIFTVASADDITVNTSAIVEFMARARHPSSRLVLYTTEPEKLPPGISPGRVELVNSVFPEQKILSSSHVAIVLPADDAHYGANGEYSNCIHYYPDKMEKYDACIRNPAEDFQGEITVKNLEAGILRRLMYNPDFAGLKVSMKRFLDNLP
ncbi:MAG: alpha/beta fold hydrolase [Gallionella sp.]|nr:alpha/beta fold hydrolase [Gallionella sp.]